MASVSLRVITSGDIINEQRRDLFEILENDDSKCRYFISKCNEYGKDVTINARNKRQGYEGRSLLHVAVSFGRLSAVTFLIKFGHTVNIYDSSTSLVTPLFDAIRVLNLECAKILIDNGANIFLSDINGENALHAAARTGHATMVKILIESSKLSVEDIQKCASVTDIKLRFPEDLAINPLCKEILADFRTKGSHAHPIRKKKPTKATTVNNNNGSSSS